MSDDEYTYTDKRGRRGCFTCRRAKSRAWHAKQQRSAR